MKLQPDLQAHEDDAMRASILWSLLHLKKKTVQKSCRYCKKKVWDIPTKTENDPGLLYNILLNQKPS